jgi:hypothetical protein
MNFLDFIALPGNNFELFFSHHEQVPLSEVSSAMRPTSATTSNSSRASTVKDFPSVASSHVLSTDRPRLLSLSSLSLNTSFRKGPVPRHSAFSDEVSLPSSVNSRHSFPTFLPIDRPESSSKFSSELDSSTQPGLHTNQPTDYYSFLHLDDLEHLGITNSPLSSTHNLEHIVPPSLPSSLTASPRSSRLVYVDYPSLPTRLPDGEDADHFEPRREPATDASNPLDAVSPRPVSSSYSPTPASSPLLGSPIITNFSSDLRNVSSYTITGSLKRGTHSTVILGYFVGDQKRELRAMKIAPRKMSGAQTVGRELDVLKWLVEVSADEEHHLEYRRTGLHFLQKMTTSYFSEDLMFIISVRTPLFKVDRST